MFLSLRTQQCRHLFAMLCFVFSFILLDAGLSNDLKASCQSDWALEQDDSGQILYVGVLANRGHDVCLQEWGPTADYLTEHLSPYEFRILPLGFDEILEEVKSPERRIAFVAANPSYYSYMEYHGLASRIATLKIPGKDRPETLFGGVILTRQDRTDIRELRDLRNKSFAAVDERSLGGWHAAMKVISDAGINPDRIFSNVTFSRTHDQVVFDVLSGKVDAGTVRTTQLERMADEGLIDLQEIRIIHNQRHRYPDYPYLISTYLYPEWPFAVLHGTDKELSKRVAITLLMMEDDHPAAMAIRGAGWTIPSDYIEVHRMLRSLLLPPYEDYGITLRAAIRIYWPWIAAIFFLFVAAIVFSVIISILRQRSKAFASQLRESEEVFRSLFENLSVGVSMINKEMEVVAINPQMKKWFPNGNYTACPKCYEAFNHPPKHGVCADCPVAKTLQDGGTHYLEREVNTRFGKRFLGVTATAITNENGDITAAIEMVDDITVRKEVEIELREAKQQAESANKAKSEFLANMSHEIRTPLNGVIGFTDLLMNTNLSETQHLYVQNAYTSAHSLLAIINDILDLSKIEANKLELEIIKTDIFELTSEAVDIIKFHAAKKGLELLLNVQPDTPRFIQTDPVRLKQILVNLLGNAVKFTEMGEVELKLSFEAIDDAKGKFRFAVRDTGIGISEAHQKRIFDVFMQADTSTTRKYGGSGLGLPISGLLAKKMGSRIELESEELKGSTFFFTLETACQDGEKLLPQELKEVNRILVVDDNENNRLILQHLFEYWGIHYTGCDRGKTALQIIKGSEPFDVIIMDYHMPEMNGLDTIQRIREELSIPPEKQPIILLHSSADDPDIIKECKQYGVRFNITKPVKSQELLQYLQNIEQPGPFTKPEQKQTETIAQSETVATTVPLILIVEDVPMNLLLIKTLINKSLPGSKVLEATDGKEAIDLWMSANPDLVFMDIQMPVMDGLEATAAIRKQEDKENREHRTPIVALTARTLKGESERFLKSGMDDFLAKPIDKNELSKKLHKYLSI